MTREEAIEVLKDWDGYFIGHSSDDVNEALDMAIQALQAQADGDLISRQALLKLMGEEPFNWTDSEKELQEVEDYRNFRNMVEQLPPVKPQEPKTGHWNSNAIQGEIDGQIVKAFTCSKCGAISVFRMTDGEIVNGDFCPNCVAKMDEPQERSDKE